MNKTDWTHVIFSDEKRFALDGPEGKTYMYVAKGLNKYYSYKRQAGGGSLLVWACVIYDQLGSIVLLPKCMNGNDYVQMLENNLLPWIDQLSKNSCVF